MNRFDGESGFHVATRSLIGRFEDHLRSPLVMDDPSEMHQEGPEQKEVAVGIADVDGGDRELDRANESVTVEDDGKHQSTGTWASVNKNPRPLSQPAASSHQRTMVPIPRTPTTIATPSPPAENQSGPSTFQQIHDIMQNEKEPSLKITDGFSRGEGDDENVKEFIKRLNRFIERINRFIKRLNRFHPTTLEVANGDCGGRVCCKPLDGKRSMNASPPSMSYQKMNCRIGCIHGMGSSPS